MAWERRASAPGRRYYYQAQWIPGDRSTGRKGTVRKSYCPAAIAQQMATLDTQLTQERAIAAQVRRQERQDAERERDAEAAHYFGHLDVLDAACDVLVRQALEAAGYHQHKGEWRKQRNAGGPHGEAGAGHEGVGTGV